MIRPPRILLLAAIAVLGLQAGAAAPAAGAGENGSVKILVNDGQVALQARDAPLEQVLTVLARRAGFALDVQGHLPDRISDAFTGLTPSATIKRLAGHHSYVIEFSRGSGSPPRVSRVSIIAREASAAKPKAQKRAKKRNRRRPPRRPRNRGRR